MEKIRILRINDNILCQKTYKEEVIETNNLVLYQTRLRGEKKWIKRK